MTTKTLSEYIGQTLAYHTGKLAVSVIVKDARDMFGRTDLLISPVSGQGEQWVSLESCKQPETK